MPLKCPLVLVLKQGFLHMDFPQANNIYTCIFSVNYFTILHNKAKICIISFFQVQYLLLMLLSKVSLIFSISSVIR